MSDRCPFCGHEDLAAYLTADRSTYVVCKACGARSPILAKTRKKTLAAFTRPAYALREREPETAQYEPEFFAGELVKYCGAIHKVLSTDPLMICPAWGDERDSFVVLPFQLKQL